MTARRAPAIRVQPADGGNRSASIHYPAAKADPYFPADLDVRAWRSPSDGQVTIKIGETMRLADDPWINLWCSELVALGALATIVLVCEPEKEDPAGQFSDPRDVAFARAASDGNPWPWCRTRVRAEWLRFVGESSWRGGCSYADDAAYRAPGSYYDDQIREALGALRDAIERAGGRS